MTEIRYCKQPNKKTCNPTNILNAAKWAGNDVSMRKDFQRIKDRLEWAPNGGACDPSHTALKGELSPARIVGYIYGPSVDQLKDYVQDEAHAVMLTFMPDHELKKQTFIHHEVLVVGFEDGHFLCTNCFKQKGPALQRVHYDQVQEWLSRGRHLFHRLCAGLMVMLTKGDEPEVKLEGIHIDRGIVDDWRKLLINERIEEGDVIIMGNDPWVAGETILGWTYMELSIYSIHPVFTSLISPFYRRDVASV